MAVPHSIVLIVGPLGCPEDLLDVASDEALSDEIVRDDRPAVVRILVAMTEVEAIRAEARQQAATS